MHDLRRWFLPSIAALVAVLQILRNTVTPAASSILSFDGDVALHILLGDLMWARGGWLDTEPTNYLLTDETFIAHEWLLQLAMSASHTAFGLAGPVLITAFVLAALSAAMFRRMHAEGTGTWPAVITLVSAFMVMNGHLHPRPHMFTWAFAFLWLDWLEGVRTDRLSPRAFLGRTSGLMLLWAQCHGGFLVAFPLTALYGAGALFEALTHDDPAPALQRFRTLLYGGVLALLVSGLNPWGFALHAHFLAWLGNDYMMSFTTEFVSPDFNSSAGAFLGAYLALGVLSLALPRRRPHPEGLLLWLSFTWLSLQTARHGALFAVLTAPFVAHRLQLAVVDALQGDGLLARLAAGLDASSRRLDEAEDRFGGWATVGLVAVAVTLAVGVGRTPEVRFLPSLQPVEAADFIEAHETALPDRMFNPFRWGAYLSYRLYPDEQVFMNSWHDHLGERMMRRYFRVHDVLPGWDRVLDHYEVGWVVYETRSRLAHTLDHDDRWTAVHRDPTATVWVRSDALGGLAPVPRPESP